ncbi:hypothetical protein D3C74_465960 [compost metagenome]
MERVLLPGLRCRKLLLLPQAPWLLELLLLVLLKPLLPEPPLALKGRLSGRLQHLHG